MRGDQAAREAIDLRAVVVEVVLPGDDAALRLEDAREAVADGGPARAAEVHRSGRVRGDELEVHGDALVEVAFAVVLALLDDAARELTGGGGVEPDVEEARSGDVGLGDPVLLHEERGDVRGELPRHAPEALGELEREARGPVAVVAVAGPFERHGGVGDLGIRAGDLADDAQQQRLEFGRIHDDRA
ncbi:hypothetical protein GCM10025881_05280 [Pseudolysinimonas kribbensis]|uniref:Uncharacterized protein n=1 Tax=Pseudolysinimonas kribbensis TaxID=433641 RepID=A0ABQ6K083_9MICO|nr:hypothetical protein GCM10025881_05280 [Pseudolysinimonas kribbensis]